MQVFSPSFSHVIFGSRFSFYKNPPIESGSEWVNPVHQSITKTSATAYGKNTCNMLMWAKKASGFQCRFVKKNKLFSIKTLRKVLGIGGKMLLTSFQQKMITIEKIPFHNQ